MFKLLPTRTASRIVALIWFAACFAVLVFAFLNRSTPDADLVVIIFLFVLGFPASLALSAILTAVLYFLLQVFNIEVPGGFVFNACEWFFYVPICYLQWRLMLPYLFRHERDVA